MEDKKVKHRGKGKKQHLKSSREVQRRQKKGKERKTKRGSVANAEWRRDV